MRWGRQRNGARSNQVDLAAVVNCAEEVARCPECVGERQGALELLEEGREEADAAREVAAEAAHGPARLRERGDLRRHTRRHGLCRSRGG